MILFDVNLLIYAQRQDQVDHQIGISSNLSRMVCASNGGRQKVDKVSIQTTST